MLVGNRRQNWSFAASVTGGQSGKQKFVLRRNRAADPEVIDLNA